jgi:hypothetical protein
MSSDCTKAKHAMYKDNLRKMGVATGRALCQQVRDVTSALIMILQAEYAIVQPIATAEKVFMDNFIIFPLNAVISSSEQVSDKSGMLFSLLFDRSCKDGKVMNDAIESAGTAKTNAVMASLKDTRDSAIAAQKYMDKKIADLQTSITGLQDINKLDCF